MKHLPGLINLHLKHPNVVTSAIKIERPGLTRDMGIPGGVHGDKIRQVAKISGGKGTKARALGAPQSPRELRAQGPLLSQEQGRSCAGGLAGVGCPWKGEGRGEATGGRVAVSTGGVHFRPPVQ